MMWEAVVYDSGERHVIPLDDLRPHDHMPDCWCGPRYDDGIWVHNAADRREEYERGRRYS